MDELINYVRFRLYIDDVEGENVYYLLILEQGELFLHDYTKEFNNSYARWKGSISINADVYMYICWLKNRSLRADLVENLLTVTYFIIIALQNDATKNYVWRSTSALALTATQAGGESRQLPYF
jgi:hypothetical protein